MEMQKKLLKIQESDNVAIAVTGLKMGEEAECCGEVYRAAEDIPVNHKIALRDFQAGDEVIKYGSRIGLTTAPIARGAWVHSHNMKTGLEGMLDYVYQPSGGIRAEKEASDTFLGYLRPNGDAGTRNEIWIIPTVACVNQTARLWRNRLPNGMGICVTAFMPTLTIPAVLSWARTMRSPSESWPVSSTTPMPEAFWW